MNYIFNIVFHKPTFGYVYVYTLLFIFQQTPQFLMISRKEAEAEETIRKLRISHNVRQTIADIRYSIAEDQGTPIRNKILVFVFHSTYIVLAI